MNRRRIVRWIILVAAVWLLLWGMPKLARLYVDWLWFGEVGYRVIFWRSFWSKTLTGLIFGLGFFAIVYFNVYLARRLAPRTVWYDDETRFRLQIAYEFQRLLERWLGLAALVLVLLISYAVGQQAATHWLGVLLAFNPTPFGRIDPLFHRDFAFYVFQLPLLEMVRNYLAGAVVLAFSFSAGVHYLDRAIRTVRGIPAFAPHVKVHLSVLLAFWLILKAWDYRLQSFNLLYSEHGVVFGATYADVHARLFMFYILTVVALIGAIVALINLRFRGFALPLAAVALLILVSFVGASYPAAIQRYVVTPNEQTKEAPYIKQNIEATRFGFNLHGVQDSTYPTLREYTAATLANEAPTVQNVRLWDHRPLLEVYRQKQRLQPYYQFADVDIDRYSVNGQYRQVMLSAREISLDPEDLPGRGWQNEHIFYTHGYGAALSPVKEVTGAGEPLMLVRDIPPVSTGLPKITRAGIYFGEIAKLDQFSLVHTNLPENDYPLTSQKNATTMYSGKGGVSIRSALARLLLSIHFGDINLLLSTNVTPQSRVIFRRSIYDRLAVIAPFLAYDYDPYVVISEGGKLYWIRDAYTLTRRLPYSQPYEVFPGRETGTVNYIRNSIKVVVDAYDGTTRFYIADQQDPLLGSLRKVFPGVFTPLSELPEDLNRHIRYPEELFNLQARVLTAYHMTDMRQFYSKLDLWEIAREKQGKQTTTLGEYSAPSGGQGEQIQAYYALMRLPGQQEPEFLLMIPFTPLNRNNMVAWMAARCDPEHYGELITYEFPRAQQVWGPIQFEAQIDQHSEISKLLTWWGQRGSEVVRGNLLIIPLGESLLYVEPIFLKAEVTPIPQLKLVVVGRQVGETMQVYFGPTLERALASAVGTEPPLNAEALLEATTAAAATPTPAPGPAVGAAPPIPPPAPALPPAGVAGERLRANAARAREHLRLADEDLRRGDLAGYQREVEKARAVLEEMARE